MTYASKTTVSQEKSRMEIEKILVRYSATSFAYGWEGLNAVVMFVMKGKHIRFLLPLPNPEDKKFKFKLNGWEKRTQAELQSKLDQATRSKWRALCLAIKAKLESIETGITDFEHEFLAHIVLPNGKTVSQEMIPRIDEAYKTGKMPKLLLGASN